MVYLILIYGIFFYQYKKKKTVLRLVFYLKKVNCDTDPDLSYVVLALSQNNLIVLKLFVFFITEILHFIIWAKENNIGFTIMC